MISTLRGTVTELGVASATIEVSGIGYQVWSTPNVLSRLTKDADIVVFIHDHIREESHDLYGFLSREELEMFESLIQVSGVGPKVALAILSIGTVETLRRAIMNGDITTLTSIPGIGKKIAQKIVLELKGQLVEADESVGPDKEVIDALVSLGYSSSQAKEALQSVSTEVTDVSERVREALRNLSS